MDLKLKGKRALVQGASTGLGRGIAEALIAEGTKVAICSRNPETLKIAAADMGAAADVACDLSQPGSGTESVRKTIEKLGGIDILVINTGGPPKGQFPEITLDKWQQGFQSLWLSAVESIQSALPEMRKQQWGRILLVTSVAAKEPMPGLTVSNGLRAGLLGLTRSVSHEIAADGITINALLPGYTRTERLKELKIDESKMISQIPARRLGEPWELGALAAFLASDLAGYVTGQTISCDGGWTKGI